VLTGEGCRTKSSAIHFVTVNVVLLSNVPPEVVTATKPVVAPAGTVAVLGYLIAN
jgi:hypothetical protein